MLKLNNPIIMHINYFEQGQTIEYTIRRAAEIGYDGIEFRRTRNIDRRRNNLADEPADVYLDEIKRCSDKYGLKYTLFGGPSINVMTHDENAVQHEIDEYKRFIDEADKRSMLTLLNFFTGPADGTEDWQWDNSARACQILSEYAPDVKFAFETHMGYIHDRATTARKLTDMIDRPNFGINLDYGNSVYFEKGTYPSLEDSIDICGDKLFYTHMKNSVAGNPGRIPTSLSQGEINHRQYVNKLAEVGFSGFIGIEAPRPGDREYFAEEDLAYLKSVLTVK